MRKFKVIVLVCFLLLPSYAQAQGFLLGLATGYVISGDNSYGSASPSILYQANKDIINNITSPLGIKIISYSFYGNEKDYGAGLTIYQIFQCALSKDETADNYEILQVTIAVDSARITKAALWFYYIEKTKIRR